MTVDDTITLTCWLLDTRPLWPGDRRDNISKAAPDALALLPPEERKSCTGMHFLRNGKEKLGSALLKRYFVSKTLGIPWNEVRYARKDDPKHGKPGALLLDGSFANVDFNSSHQAEVIALVGTGLNCGLNVGVDIVCPNERHSPEDIDREGGFDKFVDGYDSVFSDAERRVLKSPRQFPKAMRDRDLTRKHTLDDDHLYKACSDAGQMVGEVMSTDEKLRRFFALWGYTEAYLKMEGIGLLADWIRQLEFFNVRAPTPARRTQDVPQDDVGEKVDDALVFFEGRHLKDVRLGIQAYGEEYMMAVAARPAGTKTISTDGGRLAKGTCPDINWSFEVVTLDAILEHAKSNQE
ncbi:uncharacterized protein EI97DRAFT_213316 [Westerdykella ornata]|uniref:holo-[acyl-carrier-protein] synthase n=1 Tax=Westerdykella ornata TaxID=318751 RepID=A0A6A6J7M4_WESOR|nr:uncharacterized protein EI97DRAFT_213316 [Westerdykella ornata]KAF2272395.1 hypothetical protein EI97DRAFT_213316 [Westerdykella ornata]